MENTSLFAAFSAGLLSFLSPCILPLIPAYLSFISGVSLSEMRREESDAKSSAKVLSNALFFVIGFSFVFVALGASATFLGKFLMAELGILRKVAGVLVILLGLLVLGVFRIGFLDQEKRYHHRTKSFGLLGSFLIGMAFALGWTPCIGPILAAILFLASTKETVAQGIGLLGVYSAGLGIPFLLAALAVHRFLRVSSWIKSHFQAIKIVSGLLLIAVGILMLTDDLTRITESLMKLMGSLRAPLP
jgi:cytochrome c-type biogenesis protein